MHKLAVLLTLLAVPVMAQDQSTWSVEAQGRVCTATQATFTSGSGRLSVTYDAARREVILTSADRVESPLPDTGAMDLVVVFLDNGRTKFDDQWGLRHFT